MSSSKKHYLLISVLLVVVTIAVYWPVMGHEFINLDDNGYVYDNPHVKAGLTADTVKWAFTSMEEANWHPLTWLSHALDCQLYGLDKPGGHHLTGLIFHLLNVLLVFIVFTRMTGYPWRSAFVAALFAIHPLHVESVAWVAERKDVLSTFFWLLTMLAYAYYAEKPETRRYLLVLAVFALGLMAKPMLVSLPLVLLMLDYWPLGRWKLGTGKLVLEKVPLLALTLASCAITFIAQRPTAVASLEKYAVGVRVANAIVSYAGYLKKMVWPADMAVFYGHLGRWIPVWETTLSLVVLVGLTALVVAYGRRKQYLVMGWLWYVVTLVPVIGLVQVGNQARADRYTYVPLLGVFAALTWLVAEMFSPAKRIEKPRQQMNPRKMKADKRRAAKTSAPEKVVQAEPMRLGLAIPAVVVILILSVIAFKQVGYWKDDITLFGHRLEIAPGDAAARVIVAYAYEQRGMTEEAIREYGKAAETDGTMVDADYNMAALLAKADRYPEAKKAYEAALRKKPHYAQAHSSLGNLMLKQAMSERAAGDFAAAEQKLVEAEKHFREAVRLDPNNSRWHYNLGAYMYDTGQNEEAVRYYRKSVELDPDYGSAHKNLAVALYFVGNYAESWKEVQESRKLREDLHPDFLKALEEKMPEPKW